MPLNDNLKLTSRKHINPEKVVEILKANGTIVTLEEATKIIDLMRSLAIIAANENVSTNENQ